MDGYESGFLGTAPESTLDSRMPHIEIHKCVLVTVTLHCLSCIAFRQALSSNMGFVNVRNGSLGHATDASASSEYSQSKQRIPGRRLLVITICACVCAGFFGSWLPGTNSATAKPAVKSLPLDFSNAAGMKLKGFPKGGKRRGSRRQTLGLPRLFPGPPNPGIPAPGVVAICAPTRCLMHHCCLKKGANSRSSHDQMHGGFSRPSISQNYAAQLLASLDNRCAP